jgi:single-strand DNA-binding protein
MNYNKATIIGNITRDPELKALPSGSNVCSFSVATNRSYKKTDGTKTEEVQFHNCVAFGKTAELIHQYMKKGSQILVEGRLQTRNWETKDGGKRSTTEIVVENMQFGNKPRNEGESTSSQNHDPADEIPSEEIPF